MNSRTKQGNISSVIFGHWVIVNVHVAIRLVFWFVLVNIEDIDIFWSILISIDYWYVVVDRLARWNNNSSYSSIFITPSFAIKYLYHSFYCQFQHSCNKYCLPVYTTPTLPIPACITSFPLHLAFSTPSVPQPNSTTPLLIHSAFTAPFLPQPSYTTQTLLSLS